MRRLVSSLIVLVSITVLFFSGGVYAASPNYPEPNGFVVDTANIIDDSTEARITERLQDFETTSTIEIAVATVFSLEDLSIEEYAIGLFQKWGVGKAKQDDGVLLLVAPNERKVRIEVGYGLEGALTDLESSQIINTILIPAFKTGNYSQGIDDATNAIIQSVQGEYTAQPFVSDGVMSWTFTLFFLFIAGFIGFVIFSQAIITMSRTKSIAAGGILGGGIGSFIGSAIGSVFIGMIFGTGFGILVDWAVSRLPHFKKLREKAEQIKKETEQNWPPRGGSSWGGFGGGGSSGGGFGGGRSGGGGSSGSW